MALQNIRSSDAWILTTDGEISGHQVTALTSLAHTEHVMQIPIVLLIVGGRYSKSPEMTNISVAIPFYAGVNDAILLFKDIADGRIYVVSAKGAFQALAASADEDLAASWESLRYFANEEAFKKECAQHDISVICHEDRQALKGVSLGPSYEATTGCLVNVDLLLQQANIASDDLEQLLNDEAIGRLAIICKTWGKLDTLRAFLQRHKLQEVTLRLEDRHGAGRIMEQMQNNELTSEAVNHLRDRLREAHCLNRADYQNLVNAPSDEARRASSLNRALDKALAYLTSLDKASYTADILSRKSNRAMRAERIDAADAKIHPLALDLSDEVEAYRSECAICAGEEEVMSIVLKQLDPATMEENTTNFALDFPLAAGRAARNVDMVSSQCICFQCALHCGTSIYKESLAAIHPTVAYENTNKRYLNHQLCSAATHGLKTGMAGVAQLFMTILDLVLETKEWCKVTHDNGLQDRERVVRRGVVDWMLRNMVTRCDTRETFNETGAWVKYPQALLWALDDFREAGLDSWIIQYPVAGFAQFTRMLECVDQLDEWTARGDFGLGQATTGPAARIDAARQSARDLMSYWTTAACEAKVLHLVVSAMLKTLFQQQGDSWAHPYLELVYQGFNAPGVPTDLGAGSILSAEKFWDRLLEKLGGWHDIKHCLDTISSRLAATELPTQQRRFDLCRRVQLLIFWVVFTQKGHTSPKTFFQNIRQREPLATAVLDGLKASSVSKLEGPVKDVLTSIFWSLTPKASDEAHSADKIAPFTSPFGPSALRCAFSDCGVKFYDESSCIKPDPDHVRQLRAQHLKDVFGGPGFETSSTGLPEPTHAPKPPTAEHCNLHSAIARAWSTMDRRNNTADLKVKANSQDQNQSMIDAAGQLPSKEDVMNGDKVATDHFVSVIRLQIHSTRRGNVYQTLEGCIRNHLPSFFEALKVASKKAGLADETGMDYVHHWTHNKIKAKIEYELSLTEDNA